MTIERKHKKRLPDAFVIRHSRADAGPAPFNVTGYGGSFAKGAWLKCKSGEVFIERDRMEDLIAVLQEILDAGNEV